VVGLIAGLALALVSAVCAAQDAQTPQLSFASVDWPAAIATLPIAEPPPVAPMSAKSRLGGNRAAAPALARINTIMSQQFAGIATSPVPVLVPFDVAELLRDRDAGAQTDIEQYYSGFHAASFFYPGPAGYDAAFAIRTGDIPELADSKFADPIEVQISGSALLYDLAAPIVVEGQPASGLDEEFPGIRKMILEHHLRYTFMRFGVPYVVSIACFDAGVPRYKMPTCRSADQVGQRFLRALRVAGGMPRSFRPAQPLPVERPERVSYSFGYYGPGQLLSGTGFHNQPGRVDYTVYSQIRFPLADAPAFAGSEVYQRRERSEAEDAGAPMQPWRDNFCERRGFPVAQCPAGIGHQGQDIHPGPCKPPPGMERCTHHEDVVAVRDGVILRSPRQEAAYLFVNSANEHIRFRYLHMNPHKMDADNLLNGRRVSEGEVIGEVSNFSMKENGTSYHLHFDMQVPTRYGWVFVSPYMTLVTAYERLIGQHGTELADPTVIATTDPTSTGAAPSSSRLEPDRPRPSRHVKQERGRRTLARAHRMQDKRRRQRLAHSG
jgi:murein DD-endopeptidase MepM/ murein hydrolase activator NlpD